MLVATVIVVGLLSTMRLPEIRIVDPLLELIVDIAHFDQLPVEVVPIPEVLPVPEEVLVPTEAQAEVVEKINLPADSLSEVANQAEESGAESATQPVVTEQPNDWVEQSAEAVHNAVDEMEKTYSVNPGFDEVRAGAAIRFRPSEAPVEREIWENVEKDELGRTLLRKGDCFRVLDDPSAVNQWVFDNFDQYITYCTYRKYAGKDLAWVTDVYQRFAYLRNRKDREIAIFEDD